MLGRAITRCGRAMPPVRPLCGPVHRSAPPQRVGIDGYQLAVLDLRITNGTKPSWVDTDSACTLRCHRIPRQIWTARSRTGRAGWVHRRHVQPADRNLSALEVERSVYAANGVNALSSGVPAGWLA